MSRHLWRRRLLPTALATLGLTAVLAAPTILGKVVASAMQADTHHHAQMSDEEMRRWVEDWFSKHPEVGRGSATAAVADTFFVLNNLFNSDGNTSTVVDTAKILLGDAVMFRWQQGFHTATSGSGVGDPQAGAMFDVPVDNAHAVFTTPAYNTAGTFRFFCRPHEGFNMRGVVLVRAPVGVEPVEGGALGFTLGPTPNPTRAGIHFGFALPGTGRVRADVLDLHGRRVAAVLDRDFGAGTHAAAWNGHDDRGALPPAGVYYLRLRAPGSSEARRFVITR